MEVWLGHKLIGWCQSWITGKKSDSIVQWREHGVDFSEVDMQHYAKRDFLIPVKDNVIVGIIR